MKINMNFVTIIICFLLSWHDPLFASCFLSSWTFVNASVCVFFPTKGPSPCGTLTCLFLVVLVFACISFCFCFGFVFFCVFSFQFKQSSPLGRPLCFCLIIHVCFSSVFLGFLFLVYFVFLVCLCSLCICVFSPQPKSRHRVPRPLLVPQSSHCCPHRANCKEENQNEISTT